MSPPPPRSKRGRSARRIAVIAGATVLVAAPTPAFADALGAELGVGHDAIHAALTAAQLSTRPVLGTPLGDRQMADQLAETFRLDPGKVTEALNRVRTRAPR